MFWLFCAKSYIRNCCCKRETRQAALQLILLCVASCSWTAFVISLSLSTADSPKSSHRKRVSAQQQHQPPTPNKNNIDKQSACDVCIAHHDGPPTAYQNAFSNTLNQMAMEVIQLNQPLVPQSLRIHLNAISILLKHILHKLHLLAKEVPSTRQRLRNEDLTEVLYKYPDPTELQIARTRNLACPQRFLGTRAGYPRYQIGFQSINCSKIPIEKNVAIITWDIREDRLSGLLQTIHVIYPNMRVIYFSKRPYVHHHRNLEVHVYGSSFTETFTNSLQKITLPYLLLSPELSSFSRETQLERLLWISEYTGAWAVGGSIKEKDGNWRHGCILAEEDDGELVFKRAYQTSAEECMLCHIPEGPVLIRSSWIRRLDAWPIANVPTSAVVINLFYQIFAKGGFQRHAVMVCPDSLFHVNGLSDKWDNFEDKEISSYWESLATKRGLTSTILPSGVQKNYSCSFIPQGFNFPVLSSKFFLSGTSRSQSCLAHELKILLKKVFYICESSQITCFIKNWLSTASEQITFQGRWWLVTLFSTNLKEPPSKKVELLPGMMVAAEWNLNLEDSSLDWDIQIAKDNHEAVSLGRGKHTNNCVH